jgi:hypothetical protein
LPPELAVEKALEEFIISFKGWRFVFFSTINYTTLTTWLLMAKFKQLR